MGNYILFDPITGERKATTYQEVCEITGLNKRHIAMFKLKMCKIKSLNCYILSADTSLKILKELMAKEKIKDEYWVDVPGTSKKYKVSNYGRVKSYAHKKYENGRFMVPNTKNKSERLSYVIFMINNKKIRFYIHILVASVFIGRTKDKYIVHKNGITCDNRACNLMCVDKDYVINLCKKARYKPIVKLDAKTGDFIKEYKSIVEAATEHFISPSSISKCLIGKTRICAGFKWEYIEE